MARIQNYPGRTDGGYTRVMGDATLGKLLSRTQSAIIAAGTELEKIVYREVDEQGRAVTDLDAFLEAPTSSVGAYLVNKRSIKRSRRVQIGRSEPDLVIFDTGQKHVYIVELKDGDMFDTKKVDGELNTLIAFQNAISPHIPYMTSIHFCSFNQTDKAQIISGFKGKIDENQAMTGAELCQILRIDYEKILQQRMSDAAANRAFFIDELLKDPMIRKDIIEILIAAAETSLRSRGLSSRHNSPSQHLDFPT